MQRCFLAYNLLSFDTKQSIINMLIMVMLLNIFSGTSRSRYYAPDVLKPKKWKRFGIRQIGHMHVGLFQNSYGVTFCVKFDAIHTVDTVHANNWREFTSWESVFCGKAGTYTSITSLGKVTWLYTVSLLRMRDTNCDTLRCYESIICFSSYNFISLLKETFFKKFIFKKDILWFIKRNLLAMF